MGTLATIPSRLRVWLTTTDGRIALAIFVLLSIYYAILTPVDFTIGDGPELVLAGYTLGNPHPSGYPLFAMLTFVFSHMPGPSPFWNTAVALSGLTTAGSTVFLYLTMRRLAFAQIPSVLAAAAWAGANPIVYQATRVEVYGLHCLFFGAAIWASMTLLVRARPDETEATEEQGEVDESQLHIWAALAVTFVCLGLTNHLTTVFLVVPVVITIALADRRLMMRPRYIVTYVVIAALGAAVYAYLPLTAMANTGDRFSWNDPQTLENFLRHVTGAEYAKHRDFSSLGPSLMRFLERFDGAFFPGIAVLSGLGLFEIATRRWRAFVTIALVAAPLLIYVGSYQINDIATYDPPIYWLFLIAAGAAADWLLRVRFNQAPWHPVARQVAIAGVSIGIAFLFWFSRSNAYKERLGHDHSTTIWNAIEKPAIIFSDLDRHTFPLWYQTLVNHPESDVVAFDSVMLAHSDMKWYRRWLQKRYPSFKFPTDEVIEDDNWRDWMIRNNPDHKPYALLHQPWRGRKTHAVLRGPYHEILPGRPEKPPSRLERKTSLLWMSSWKRVRGQTYWTSMSDTFELGDPIACVVEWIDHDGLSPTWRLVGPDGAVVTYDKHPVPSGSNVSWEYFKAEDQKPGEWRCEIREAGQKPISITFTITD